MAITTNDGYLAATKQALTWVKTATRTTIAGQWFSLFDIAGQPGAGTLAAGNTANGLVPTDATAGYPTIAAFGGANTGYLSGIDFGSSVACRIAVFDRLFLAGAYSFNSNVSLASQPSFSARLPAASYHGCELWLEQVTASTGVQTVVITYTNSDGVSGRSVTVSTGTALTVGRALQIPLQAGDRGIQRIDSIVGSVATAGTFNLMILRRLWSGRVRIANDGDTHGYVKTKMRQVYADSALYVLIAADGTSSGLPELQLEISDG